MPLIVTPGYLSKRAAFYRQVAQFTSAGISLLVALEQLGRSPPASSFRKPIQHLLDQLNQGFLLSEALKSLGKWMPPFDIALIEAGEQSGKLDHCFHLLGDYYHDRAQAARVVITDLVYPVILLHCAVLLLPFPQFFLSGNLGAFLRSTLGVLLPIYAFVALLLYATQARHGERWRLVVEELLNSLPLVGTARRYLALSRLAAALEALLGAGVPIVQAWELAATASGSQALHRTVRAWKPRFLAGETPAEAVNASKVFPEIFASLYRTGEVSGSMEQTLQRLHEMYREEGTRKLRTAAEWGPRLLYLVIVVLIAMRILQFWTGFYAPILNPVEP